LELNWSTFVLEIINFLVLVWILKRFLYRPVLDVIARRRASIEAQLAESQRLHDEADTLKRNYENRLADWDHERQLARDTLAQELDTERVQQMQALQTTLAQEREKAQVAESRQRTEAVRKIEHQAMQQSAQFASRLLAEATGPELEMRLLDLLLDNLTTLTPEQITALRTQWGQPPASITVASAYPLPEDRKQRLQEKLAEVTGLNVPIQYTQKTDLLAGLRITIGAWILNANVRDELQGFVEFARVAR